ncbi:hypothetical protein [Flavobacterium fluviatile]|uniref:hypothetical protein n=1 Tax=Flavobacterium fluviatile TaxID=1862387 RepID=UPI0013D73360|nr:hypothetical protein [Flavobacterium fluviatile]
MKRMKIYFYVLIGLMLSCQKETNQEEDNAVINAQKTEWLSANLDAKFAGSQKLVTAYLLSVKEMRPLLEAPEITQVRFVLGYADNTVQITLQGVDKSGNELGSVKSTILKNPDYLSELSAIKELSASKTSKKTVLLNSHLWSPADAFKGIEQWQQKLNTVDGVEEAISFEGKRFRHFTLEAEIIREMLSKDIANIGVFLGLNQQEKVTTILIGLDKNNKIKKNVLTAKQTGTGEGGDEEEVEEVDVYDGTRPSPPF